MIYFRSLTINAIFLAHLGLLGCGSQGVLKNQRTASLANPTDNANGGKSSGGDQIVEKAPNDGGGPPTNPPVVKGPEPLPVSLLSWDGKTFLGTAELQLVPVN